MIATSPQQTPQQVQQDEPTALERFWEWLLTIRPIRPFAPELDYWMSRCNHHGKPAAWFWSDWFSSVKVCACVVFVGYVLDVLVPYPKCLSTWANTLGFGLRRSPEEIVGGVASYLLTALPLFTAVMTYVISGTRESTLSLQLLDNRWLRMLIAWFPLTVADGFMLSTFLHSTARHDWLLSHYVFGLCFFVTISLALLYVSQQLRRTTVSREIDVCLRYINRWRQFLVMRERTDYVIDSIETYIEGAFQALNTFLRLNMDSQYSAKRERLGQLLAKYAIELLHVARLNGIGTPVQFLMTKYASHMAVLAERRSPLTKKVAEEAVSILGYFVKTPPVLAPHTEQASIPDKLDRLAYVSGLAALRTAGQAFVKGKHYDHLNVLLEALIHQEIMYDSLALLSVTRLLQTLLLEAAESEDHVAIDQILYRLRDLAEKLNVSVASEERQTLNTGIRLYLYQVIVAAATKAIENSRQVSAGWIIKTMVRAFPEQESTCLALTRLLATREVMFDLPGWEADPLGSALTGFFNGINLIGPPITFDCTTSAHHFLKFTALWYGQQVYTIQQGADYGGKLRTAVIPTNVRHLLGGTIPVDYMVSKVTAGKYHLLFLQDGRFMKELRRDLKRLWAN